MRYSMRCMTLVSSLALAGCAAAPVDAPEVHIQTAPIAVAVGCVKDRPADVVPMNKAIPREQWLARAPGAKAETIKAQAGTRQNYEDALKAATSACTDAPKN